jgi:hypothetical protein
MSGRSGDMRSTSEIANALWERFVDLDARITKNLRGVRSTRRPEGGASTLGDSFRGAASSGDGLRSPTVHAAASTNQQKG